MSEQVQYLTKLEAAEYLRVSWRTIDELRARGELMSARVGGKRGRIIFSREILDAYIKKQFAASVR